MRLLGRSLWGPRGSRGARFLTWGGPWAPRGDPLGARGVPLCAPYGPNTHISNGFTTFQKNEKSAPGSLKRGQGESWAPLLGFRAAPGGDSGPKEKCSVAAGPPKRAPDDRKGFAGADSVVSGASKGPPGGASHQGPPQASTLTSILRKNDKYQHFLNDFA